MTAALRPGSGEGEAPTLGRSAVYNRVIGLDLSLTNTGMAVAKTDGSLWVDRIRPPKNLTGIQRLRHIVSEIDSLIGWDRDLVVVEGLAYASQTGKASERSGLWYMTWNAVHDLADWTVVSPTARAKYATGRGNASKDEVLAAAVLRYHRLAEITDNNVADAVVLAAAGMDWLGRPLAPVPQSHRAALDAVPWPQRKE